MAFGSSAGVDPAVFDILSLGDFPGTTAADGDRLPPAVRARDHLLQRAPLDDHGRGEHEVGPVEILVGQLGDVAPLALGLSLIAAPKDVFASTGYLYARLKCLEVTNDPIVGCVLACVYGLRYSPQPASLID